MHCSTQRIEAFSRLSCLPSSPALPRSAAHRGQLPLPAHAHRCGTGSPLQPMHPLRAHRCTRIHRCSLRIPPRALSVACTLGTAARRVRCRLECLDQARQQPRHTRHRCAVRSARRCPLAPLRCPLSRSRAACVSAGCCFAHVCVCCLVSATSGLLFAWKCGSRKTLEHAGFSLLSSGMVGRGNKCGVVGWYGCAPKIQEQTVRFQQALLFGVVGWYGCAASACVAGKIAAAVSRLQPTGLALVGRG